MTSNQRLVLAWLKDNCSAIGIIKVSNSELGSVFGWSQPYAKKILSSLVNAGHLEELQKGMGHRATKYRVSSSHNQNGASHNKGETSQQVHSDAPKRVGLVINNKPTLFIIGNTHTSTHTHIRGVFDNVERPLKPVKTNASPFKRFRGKWDQVEKWNATDFVCYFSFVHKVRFGDAPVLNWPIDVVCARTLFRRLKTPAQLKAFIQVAFSICKRKPNGLRSFVYDYNYEQVINTDEDYIEKALDEYDDEYVFPWLAQESRRKGAEATREYLRSLTLRGLGISS